MKERAARACGYAIAAALIILIVVCMRAAALRYSAYMTGMWASDPASCARAGLSAMQLFVGPAEKPLWPRRRQGYLLMVSGGGEIVANQAINIRERSMNLWGGAVAGFQRRDRYSVPIELEYDDRDRPMPTRLQLTLSQADGSLTLHDGSNVYAFMRKDYEATPAALEAYGY